VKVLHSTDKKTHKEVSDYDKTDIAMSHLTHLSQIFPCSCHKVTNSSKEMTELCRNDRVALIDVSVRRVSDAGSLKDKYIKPFRTQI
jgi:hypothetical protein